MVESREFWSGQAARWDKLAGDADSFYRRRSTLIADLIQQHAGGSRVLDVGCGSGELCAMLAARGFSVHGTDLSEEMIALARMRCRALVDRPAVRFATCTADRIPFGGHFDVVTAIGVFPYVADHPRFAARLAGHLAGSGLLVATSTNPVSLFTAKEMAVHLAKFRPTRSWWLVLRNLLRTGVWSGGLVSDHSRQALSASAFDRMMLQTGLSAVAAVDLFNVSPFGADLDRNALARPRLQALIARRLAWTHIGAFRLGPTAMSHA